MEPSTAPQKKKLQPLLILHNLVTPSTAERFLQLRLLDGSFSTLLDVAWLGVSPALTQQDSAV